MLYTFHPLTLTFLVNHLLGLQQIYQQPKPCYEGIELTFRELNYIEVLDEVLDEEAHPESINFEELKSKIYKDGKIWIITGEAGSGKTTSINQLGHDEKPKLDLEDTQKLLISVHFADLEDCKLLTVIKKAIPHLDDDGLECIQKDIIGCCGAKYIFALDGYDEYQNKREQNFITELINLNKCTIVISTRPHSSEYLKLKLKQGHHSRRFKEYKIAQFNNIDAFIMEYYESKAKKNANSDLKSAKEKAEKVANRVKRNDFFHSLCSRPLHCAMVCSFLDNDFKTPQTRTQLFNLFVATTVERHYIIIMDKIPKEVDSEDDTLREVASKYSLDIREEMLKPVYKVCRLAYEKVTGLKPSIKLDDQSSLGLVVVKSVIDPLKVLPENEYTFLHETIKEYLAALYMLLSGDLDVSKMREENQLEVRKFLCGLTRNTNFFKTTVLTKPGEKFESYWIQCAHETQQPEARKEVMRKVVTERGIFNCRSQLSPDDCVVIFKVLEASKLHEIK